MRRPLDDCDDAPTALIRRLGDAHGQDPDVVIDAILDVIQAARDL